MRRSRNKRSCIIQGYSRWVISGCIVSFKTSCRGLVGFGGLKWRSAGPGEIGSVEFSKRGPKRRLSLMPFLLLLRNQPESWIFNVSKVAESESARLGEGQ